jgi:M3 family oligoendopeptidase
MGMEYFAWPWMNKFFGAEAGRYKYEHLAQNLMFIPYDVAVDEFQHFVYAHPEVSPQERKLAWRMIEKKYLPHLDYEDNEYLENGGYWHQQLHIFLCPFYYIDYTLAQICALQFWQRSQASPAEAWSDYLQLCRYGGSRSFGDLLETIDLQSPFSEGCVDSITAVAGRWLEREGAQFGKIY